MDHAIVFFTSSKTADIVSLSAITGARTINSTVKVRWNRKSYTAKIVLIATKSRCEEKIADVGEDGKLVERFFTVGESTTISESDVLSQRGDEILARENSDRTNADNRELVEQIRLMRLATVGAFRDLDKRMDRMEYRQERQIAALQAEIRELKEQLSCRSAEGEIDNSIFPQDRLEAILSLKHGSLTKFALAVEQEMFEDNPTELLKNVEDRIYSAKKIDYLRKAVFKYFTVSKSSEKSVADGEKCSER
uniref:PKcGMP_CC domain-containing protein n=1 Tax=Haemonchus contortus TaxID=6289 RepID=A0A7I4Z5D1_HAECO